MRRRLARDLHDDFSPRLAGLALELESVRRKVGDGDPLRTELGAIGAGLAALSEDLRRAGHDLHPASLERRGLLVALRDHLSEVEHRSGIPVVLDLSAPPGFPDLPLAHPPLPLAVALELFRFAQEALANAVRHAAARTVRVRLAISSDEVRLAVVDDGRGFEPSRAGEAGGLGLVILAERTATLGGNLRVSTTVGVGTEIELRVPRDPVPAAVEVGSEGGETSGSPPD